MDLRDILKRVDHTLLSQTAGKGEIKSLLDDGMRYSVASCCIPPCYVAMAKDHVGNRLKICTVIGFPNGYHDSSVKVFETEKALEQGADEIDMVINLTMVKNGMFNQVLDEIKQVKAVCGQHVLKVIVETCLLNEMEKKQLCAIVTESGADYIKTSTGFSTGGATNEDVALFKAHVGNHVKIKASGGIASVQDAVSFIELGADRLGTSRLVKIAKEMGI